MKLSIVIPALNEEQSIARIIERTLGAFDHICAESPVDQCELIIVSDGSTDKTAEYARKFIPDIRLIEFPKNRGYGAAIKEGWRQATGEWLAFLDADGTCDPLLFADLCNCLSKDQLDIVLGCRIHKNSKMPVIRRIGNWLFSILLSFLSSKKVRDTASGMRVVRRDCISKIYPLPDGLQFTPAMSARALLSHDIKIGEIDIDYREREGVSKLNVSKDGLRFLSVILKTAALYRPGILLTIMSFFFIVVAIGLMMYPLWYYLTNGQLLDWMIYRFAVTQVCVVSAALGLAAAHLSGRMVDMTVSPNPEQHKTILNRLFRANWLKYVNLLFLLIGSVLIYQSVLQRLFTGLTYEHWSRYLVMSMFFSLSTILLTVNILDKVLDLIAGRLKYIRENESRQ